MHDNYDSKNNYITSSPMHNLNPLTNLILIVSIIVLLIFLTHPVFGFLLLIFVVLLYGISGIGLGTMMKKARFLIYFSLFIFLIQFLFTPGDQILFTIIPASSPIFPGALPVTEMGIILGLSMTFRFLVIVSASFWFISITDPNKLAYSLMQLGLPYRYGFMLVTSLRFLPQFEIESNTVRNAQLARGIKVDKTGLRGIYNHIRFTLRPLIITALQKADTVSRAMEGRGFGYYKKRNFIDKSTFNTNDVIYIIMIISITVSLIFFTTIIFDQSEIIEILIS